MKKTVVYNSKYGWMLLILGLIAIKSVLSKFSPGAYDEFALISNILLIVVAIAFLLGKFPIVMIIDDEGVYIPKEGLLTWSLIQRAWVSHSGFLSYINLITLGRKKHIRLNLILANMNGHEEDLCKIINARCGHNQSS